MAKRTIELSDNWSLCGFDGYGETINQPRIPQALANVRWIGARVPGSVYADLMRAGWIADVYAGCNSLAAQWVESHYWYYRTSFPNPCREPGEHCDLVLDGLDLDAAIFLNGELIGEHRNAFRPFRRDVTSLVREGDNELLIRLDSGLISNADRRGSDYNLEVSAAVSARAYLRKPHYTCRWDWSPRLISVGIGGDARLEVYRSTRLDAVGLYSDVSEDLQHATIRIRAFLDCVAGETRELTLRAAVAGAPGAVNVTVPPGADRVDAEIRVDKPRLWWPRPYGDQPLYDVHVELQADDELLDSARRTIGLRSIELAQPEAKDGGRLFQLRVNGTPVFCKGANWVPADLLYQCVTAADYEALAELAVEANFNLLRVWGGGRYEHHDLFNACDRAGLLVWHDLPFACSKFPGDDSAFVEEVLKEVTHNVRERAHHPCLVLWCGNNEVDLGIRDEWILSNDPSSRPCQKMFHEQLAELIAREDPTRPYWPSSPLSPDGSAPNNPHIGDQHPWYVSLGEARGDFWVYRDDASRFPNEGGLLGPSTLKTLHSILPEAERKIGSRTWLHHDNTQNNWRTETLVDNILRLHLCPRPRDLSFEDYIRYGGILHGEGLQTAIDNWRRRKFETAAAIFWMFNDTWPAATSWTPIDYYRRRKPAFWYVKRACAHVRAVCVEENNQVVVYAVNDLPEPRRATLQYGLFCLRGGRPVDEVSEIECPANASVAAARFPLSAWDKMGTDAGGAFAILAQASGEVSTHRLFRERFSRLRWSPADLRLTREAGCLRLACDTFAWAVCLDADGEIPLADNYFDLIPGIDTIIPWPAEKPTPELAAPQNPTPSILQR